MGVITLYVSDIKRSEAWYCSMLGFQRTPEQYMSPGVMLQAADVTIYLTKADAQRGAVSRAGDFPGIALCFVVDSVKQSYEAMLAAGVTIAGDYYQPGPSFATVQLADPDDIVIELWGNP
jgi:catechol 2,3-dioxygenase-like lactoylglutathione lyase family enzyme